MHSISPLRYPGGKTRFTNFIWEAVAASGDQTKIFVEPFCGGAGAAISLLESNRVQRIALNDIDPLVASFWRLVFGKSCSTNDDLNWLIGKIESAELSIAEWRSQKALKPTNIGEAAWKCLYLNRTSFNGILHKAGPIGGWEQKNRKLDVRFNREKLVDRIVNLYQLRDQVEHVDSIDWKLFCTRFKKSRKAYLYLDPPYYHKAEQLYGYLFDKEMHLMMQKHLIKLSTPWMLSYDDAPEIRVLYSGLNGIDCRVIDQTYSAHPIGGASFVGRELIFSNHRLPITAQDKTPKQHVGMTVLGSLDSVATHVDGPIRTPIIRNIL